MSSSQLAMTCRWPQSFSSWSVISLEPRDEGAHHAHDGGGALVALLAVFDGDAMGHHLVDHPTVFGDGDVGRRLL